jgi:hypothetical protein
MNGITSTPEVFRTDLFETVASCCCCMSSLYIVYLHKLGSSFDKD